MFKRFHLITLLAALLTAAAACGDTATEPATNPGDNQDDVNNGGKTDLPDDAPEDSCTKRRADALQGNEAVFTKDAVRWACADVEGVNNNNQDDRGQEYCEFFAVVQPPPEFEGDPMPAPITVGRIESIEEDNLGRLFVNTTELGIEWTDDQIFHLEDYEDEVFGQCIFTSWHQGTPGPVPACDSPEGCPNVLGVEVNEDVFSMKLPTNSNEAAAALVDDCLAAFVPEGDPANPDDPLHSDFYRGCMITAEVYGTEWRRSDPAICAAIMRLGECGCSLPDNADVATSLVPPQPIVSDDGSQEVTFRGFPLGTWAGLDSLPAGCRHVDLGDGSQTVVACDLTSADLIDHSADLKRRCLEKYGDNVVVHVPVPSELITCQPPADGTYAGTCSETPWIVDN